MESTELKVSQSIGKIECNFDELKAALEVQMSAYTSLEVTEDRLKEAKDDLATLRKIRKAAEDKRKAIKNEFMQPYNDFEVKYKDFISVIDKPITEIDFKVKEFEIKRIEERQEHIKELYTEKIGEYAEFLPLENIRKDNWNNKTCSDKDIIYDISEAITKVRGDLEAIKALNSEIEDKCILEYKNSGNNLAAAIKANSDFEQAKAFIEKKQADETPVEMTPTEVTPAEVTPEINEEPFDTSPTITFRITGEENIKRIKEYLLFNEIPYQEV